MSKPRAWIGIDSGKGGAVGVIFSDSRTPLSWATPTVTTRTRRARKKTKSGKPSYASTTTYDLPKMLATLKSICKLCGGTKGVHVSLEAQRQRQRDSKQVVYQVGRGQGLWEMAVVASGLEYTLVQPSVWRPRFCAVDSDKTASIESCLRIYPTLTFPLVKDEARAEALLIAEYSRRLSLGVEFPIPATK